MRTMRVFGWATLLLVAWAVSAGTALAGKPGGGGETVPPGTIYFRGSDDRVWSMDGGGGNLTLLTGLTTYPSGTYRPSRQLHGGVRWFLHLELVPGEVGPRGSGRTDFFAVREDGAVRVRLTSDPTIEYQYKCAWGGDESQSGATIAVLAGRWTGTSSTDTVIPGSCGLYTAHLAFDGAGSVVGLDAEPALAVSLPAGGSAGRESPDVFMDFTWSPDMTRIAFNRLSDTSTIWVANLASGAVTQIGPGEEPDWSPDGSRIACRREVPGAPNRPLTAIETVRPDGSGRTTILSKKIFVSTSKSQYVSNPKWSPDGTHVAYEYLLDDHFNTIDPHYVYRVAADGSGNTNLTPDGMSRLAAWR